MGHYKILAFAASACAKTSKQGIILLSSSDIMDSSLIVSSTVGGSGVFRTDKIFESQGYSDAVYPA